MNRVPVLIGVLLVLAGLVCSCSRLSEPQLCLSEQAEKTKMVVITGGHEFEQKPFLSLFEGYEDIDYIEARQEDESEIFEDISEWDYDLMVLFNMTQGISEKRQKNFIKLLERGVGVLAIHHSIGSFQQWPEYRRIIGAKYYLTATVENGVEYEPGTYKHDIDFEVHIKDSEHPITHGLSDFLVHDETYKNCVFEVDNRVLLTTNHPTSDEPLCWVRNYGKAKVCYIQIGHGPSVYTNPSYRRLVVQAIRWCAGRED